MNGNQKTYFWGRVLLYLFLIGWGLRFLAGNPNADVVLKSFMHMVNLPIHEAGHIVFSPLGRFMGVLGGTLMQIIIPLAFVLTFLIGERNKYGSAVSLWWLAQNFMDISPYIGDARAQRLLLLGGVTGRDAPGYHDWNNILSQLGWLQHDHLIASISYDIGRILMVSMFVWGGYVLLKQYKALRMSKQEASEDES